MQNSFRGKIVVITGGASGIGLAAAKLCLEAGAQVACFDLQRSEALAALPALFIEADVGSEASLEAAFARIAAELGSTDVLINNAGMAIRQPAVDLPLENWDKVVAVNMTGVFLCARLAARQMIAAGRGGVIVNTASIMGLSGGGLYPNISYQTTKGAVVNLTRALAVEWAPHNIRVNAVAPTYVKTPFVAGILANPELMQRIEALTPLRRLAEPEEVADAICFLASDRAAMITGHTLPVDGGFLAQ